MSQAMTQIAVTPALGERRATFCLTLKVGDLRCQSSDDNKFVGLLNKDYLPYTHKAMEVEKKDTKSKKEQPCGCSLIPQTLQTLVAVHSKNVDRDHLQTYSWPLNQTWIKAQSKAAQFYGSFIPHILCVKYINSLYEHPSVLCTQVYLDNLSACQVLGLIPFNFSIGLH